TRVPNLLFDRAPHPPFAAGLSRLQSFAGLYVPLTSFHVRVAVVTIVSAGLFSSVKPTPSLARYRPMLALIAVLPFPKTSQTAPNRGSASFQFGTSLTPPKGRSGTNRPAGRVSGCTQPLK